MNLSKYQDFMVETAFLAGRLTLGYFQTGTKVEMKSDSSPVTMADRLAEETIRRRIEKNFPGHAIVGEELGKSANSESYASHRWIIDPIDGTKSFIHGVPLFAVLIGLEIEGKIEVGTAYFPALDEMISAATGFGCWWNGRRARVSQVNSIDQALFTTTSTKSYQKSGLMPVLIALLNDAVFKLGGVTLTVIC